MDSMRFFDWAGTQRTSSMALTAVSRRPVAVIEMNHWAVLRKISGALDRQLCG